MTESYIVIRIVNKSLATIGDLFQSQAEKDGKPKKPHRLSGKEKTWLDRFAPGTHVRCWWPKALDSPLNGLVGTVCVRLGPTGPSERVHKHVVIPKAERMERIKGRSRLLDKVVEEGHDCWFLTEDEYTIAMVMEL